MPVKRPQLNSQPSLVVLRKFSNTQLVNMTFASVLSAHMSLLMDCWVDDGDLEFSPSQMRTRKSECRTMFKVGITCF